MNVSATILVQHKNKIYVYLDMETAKLIENGRKVPKNRVV